MNETKSFIEKLTSIVNELKKSNKNMEIPEDSREALLSLRKNLDIIKDACLAYDKKTAKNTLNELRKETWSHETRELLNQLSELLLHSEFDEVSSLVDKFNKG